MTIIQALFQELARIQRKIFPMPLLRNIFGVAGVTVIFCASCADFQAANDGSGNFAKNEYGTNRFVIHNVELVVLIPAVIKADQPVPMTVELTNKNNHTILWDDRNGGYEVSQFNIQLLTSRHHPPYLTPLGKVAGFNLPESEYMGIIESDFTPVNPGSTQKWQVNLRDFFYLPSDAYRISVFMDIYKIDSSGNTITIPVSDIMFRIEK
jgi:hypothetical protein